MRINLSAAKKIFEKIIIVFGIIWMCSVGFSVMFSLSGCAIAKINEDTQRAYMFGIGSYKNEKGAEISVLKVPEGLLNR